MNHYKKLLDNLSNKHVSGNPYEIAMLGHLVRMLGEEKFNENVNIWFKGGYPDSFDEPKCEQYDADFYDFHKSIRQCDLFYKEEGHLDMLWWNFIQISDITYKQMRYMFDNDF